MWRRQVDPRLAKAKDPSVLAKVVSTMSDALSELLVIVDLRLPRKSGHEVIAWIRSQPSFVRLIVFMLTSSEEVEDRDRALALGADCYFIKPLRLDDLHVQARLIALRWSRIDQAYRHCR